MLKTKKQKIVDKLASCRHELIHIKRLIPSESTNPAEYMHQLLLEKELMSWQGAVSSLEWVLEIMGEKNK